jgi:ATP-dependent Clp protease ATP-binding subunit ClpC
MVDCTNAIFIMTSNIVPAKSSKPIGFNPDMPQGDESERAQLVSELRRYFLPEFLNRIDEIILFRPLTAVDLHRITQKLLVELTQRTLDQNIRLEFTPGVVKLISDTGYDPANGARPVARAVEQLVARPLSDLLISGEIPPGTLLRVEERDGRVTFESEEAHGMSV